MFQELDNTQRRHSSYYSTHPMQGWVDTPDSSLILNFGKASFAGLIGHSVQALYTHLYTGYHMLTLKYLPPQNLEQASIYLKNIRNISGQTDRLKTRLKFGIGLSLFDIGPRFMVLRWLTEGLPENPQGFNINFWRKPLPILIGSLVTCWMRAPLEIAYKAFKCDQKFPKELRVGYKSITDAFIKLGRKDPILLIKNSLPTNVGIFFQTLFAYFIYDNIIDNAHVFWDFHGFSYQAIQLLTTSFAATCGLLAAYPYQITVRRMVENAPKVQSEQVFKGNYRRALIFYHYYMPMGNGYIGFASYFHKNFFWLSITLLMCDVLKMNKRWRSHMIEHPYTNSEGSFLI